MKCLKLWPIIFILLLSSCASTGEKNSMQAQNESLAIRGEKHVHYTAMALDGDGDSAYALYIHSLFVAGDKEAASFWLRLASDAGNEYAMYVFGRELYEDKSSKDGQRYGLWLIQKSAKKGLRQAKEYLKPQE